MTWERVVGAAFTALLAIVGGSFAAGNTWHGQSALPGRVDAVEQRQHDLETGLSRVEGKVDTVINMLKRGR